MYNEKDYTFENIKVVSAGERDPDAEGVEGMSASLLRNAVIDGDGDTFNNGMPKSISSPDIQALFNSVKKWLSVPAKNKENEKRKKHT